jgi:hypothetical protein
VFLTDEVETHTLCTIGFEFHHGEYLFREALA